MDDGGVIPFSLYVFQSLSYDESMVMVEPKITKHFSMFKKIVGFSSVALIGATPFLASAAEIDVSSVQAAIASGTTAAVSLAGTYSLQGILLSLALIAGAVVIMMLWFGARKGKKIVSGRF